MSRRLLTNAECLDRDISPSILAASRHFPCCHKWARFADLRVVRRRCPVCKESFEVTFESAPAASAMTGAIVFKACWRPL